jgi:hypothetical protein
MNRGNNDFKKIYLPRIIIVKDEKGDLFSGYTKGPFLSPMECIWI